MGVDIKVVLYVIQIKKYILHRHIREEGLMLISDSGFQRTDDRFYGQLTMDN
jgi:hypothetical protein